MMDKVYILILNWNGWADTVECLESVLGNDYPDYQIIVCDNNSSNKSVERIRDWAEGRLELPSAGSARLGGLSRPPAPKPIPYAEYDRVKAESGGAADDNARFILIRTGGNLGFAGGNNVGLRYAMAKGDSAFVWLLNNDTVIRPGALTAMVLRMRERPDAGICGSTLMCYDEPDKVFALGGGAYDKWLAVGRHLGAGRPAEPGADLHRIERAMDYVVGASMLVSRRFLADVGLMYEGYFLYHEELDWALRGRGRYSLVYAPESVVYHKGAASIGTVQITPKNDLKFNLRCLRPKLLFTFRFFPTAIPAVLLISVCKLLRLAAAVVFKYLRAAFRPTLKA